MPDGSDSGRVERYTERQELRVRECVHEPNRSDILKTIRQGRRGNIASLKPNQRTKPSWSNATVRNILDITDELQCRKRGGRRE